MPLGWVASFLALDNKTVATPEDFQNVYQTATGQAIALSSRFDLGVPIGVSSRSCYEQGGRVTVTAGQGPYPRPLPHTLPMFDLSDIRTPVTPEPSDTEDSAGCPTDERIPLPDLPSSDQDEDCSDSGTVRKHEIHGHISGSQFAVIENSQIHSHLSTECNSQTSERQSALKRRKISSLHKAMDLCAKTAVALESMKQELVAETNTETIKAEMLTEVGTDDDEMYGFQLMMQCAMRKANMTQ